MTRGLLVFRRGLSGVTGEKACNPGRGGVRMSRPRIEALTTTTQAANNTVFERWLGFNALGHAL